MSSGGRTSEGGSGGTTASGGVTSSGGRTSTRIGTGGATGAGGSTTTSTSTGNTGTVVAFGRGKGQGAMTGYGYVDLGSADTVTSPTCGASEDAITSAKPCASGTNWSATDKLCVTGAIPALDAEKPDYDANWGISVGLNAADPDTGTLGQSFSKVTITMSGSPTSGLRAIVHLKGDGASVQYCHALTPGTAIALTDFSLTCWDTAAPGTKVTAAKVPDIDKIAVQVNSGSTAIDVKELCITKIEFEK